MFSFSTIILWSWPYKHYDFVWGEKRKHFPLQTCLKIRKAHFNTKHWHWKRKIKPEQNKSSVLKHCHQQSDENTVQLITNRWFKIQFFMLDVEHKFERTNLLPVRRYEHTASHFCTQWETQISQGISLCPKAVCFPTHQQKIKDNTFQIRERFLVPVF